MLSNCTPSLGQPRPGILGHTIVVSWCVVFLSINACGDLSSSDVEKSLTEGSNPVWYDTTEKTLKFPTAKSLQDAEDVLIDRHKHIYVEPPVAKRSGFWDWWDTMSQSIASVTPWIFGGLLALFVVGVVYYLWLAAERGWFVPNRRKAAQSNAIVDHERAKLVDLPYNIDIAPQGLLAQAEAFRLNEDYAKSIVYLFSHVLVELDAADCIRLQRGKTNRVYLRELQNEPRLAKLHQHLVLVFEAVFFGRFSVSREQCERFWGLLPAVQEAIQEAKLRRLRPEEHDDSARPSRSDSKTGPDLIKLGLILMGGFVGCDRGSGPPMDDYGGSNTHSRKSLSGLTVFRELCEQRGHRTNELISLSQRSQKLNTILWAPKDFRAPNDQEIYWFDEWLSTSPSRTLIYLGRDYSPASHYWRKAADAAASEDRRTFRLQEAYADAEIEAARLRSGEKLKCGWFEQQLGSTLSRPVKSFKGPWSQDLKVDDTHVVLRGPLLPNPKPRSAKLPLENTSAADRASGPSSSNAGSDDESPRELGAEMTDYGSPKIDTLLANEAGIPIISSISYQRWGDSRLILVANGSVLMNESLVNRGNGQIVERLIRQVTPMGRIGFLATDGETRIRQPWDDADPKGFEWLRIWPLSLIAIQSLFLGSIALLAMLPIFGRPQKLPSPSTTDFGKHIEALGDLLAQSRDRNYALQRIADYFREVRRDSASPWSTIAPSSPNPPSSVVSKTSLNSTNETS